MSEPTEELIIRYILKTISAEEEEEVLQLLQKEPQLYKQLKEYQAIAGLIAHSIPQVSTPDRLKANSLPLAKTENNVKSEKIFFGQNLSWHKLPFAAVSLLAVYLGIDNYFLRQQTIS
jgi:hypothetical protein